VTWSLEELPPSETGTVTLVALPIEAGEQKLKIAGRASQGLQDEVEQTITVEGLAAIMFEVVDVEDPIEVSGQTTYEVRVINQGSKAANNVHIVATFPPELKPLEAEGPTKHSVEGQRVVFEPLPQLAPKADAMYRLRAQGLAPGDLRLRVELMTAEMQTPVTKEESTRVYTDD